MPFGCDEHEQRAVLRVLRHLCLVKQDERILVCLHILWETTAAADLQSLTLILRIVRVRTALELLSHCIVRP